MPLTKEQFRKLKDKGFTTEQIASFEKRRMKDESQRVDESAESAESGFDRFISGVSRVMPRTIPAISPGGIRASGQLVENVANAVEPKPEDFVGQADRPTINPFAAMPRDSAGYFYGSLLPRQMMAEVIRGYKPENVALGMGLGVAGRAVGKGVGAVARSKPAQELGKAIAERTPQAIKNVADETGKFLTRNFTVGKGQPKAYQELADQASLERNLGLQEAEDVGQKLSRSNKDMLVKNISGKDSVIKKGEILPYEQQQYIGRIFRDEIDLGGKKSRLVIDPELARLAEKEVEVNVAFNPKISALNKRLSNINNKLKNKEFIAENLVGKKFSSGSMGNIDKVTGFTKEEKMLASGKIRTDISLNTRPVVQESPIGIPNTADFINEEDFVNRSIKQVSRSKSAGGSFGLERKALLKERKDIAKKIQEEIKDINIGIRAKYDVFDRRFSEQIRNNPKFQELSAIAKEGREIMDKWSKALADSGVPTEETKKIIEENVGNYMARMYRKHLNKTNSLPYTQKILRERLNGLKHRQELTQEVRDLLGEIKEPAFPTAARVKEISETVANAKLFKKVASNPEWTFDSNVTGNLVQMPKTPALGDLNGKWVVKEIADDINQTLDAKNASLSIYKKLMGNWKYGKVVLNPATHSRNIFSNSMLLDFSGVNHIRQAQLLPRVTADYLSKGKLYELARKNGAIGGEFVGGEIKRLRDLYVMGEGDHFSKLINTMKVPFKKAGDIYQAEEQIAKLIKFTDVFEKTGNAKLAAKEAQKWLFDYNKIPNVIKFAKEYPMPFITFTYKSVPRVVETLVNNPMKLYKYHVFFNGFNESSRKLMGMSKEDFQKEIDALPPWQSRSVMGIPSNLMLPQRTKEGNTQFLNLEYNLPFGAIPDMAQTGFERQINNPAITLISDFSKNRDFRDKKIVPVGASKKEELMAKAEHAYRTLAPSFAPPLPGIKGGYSSEKVMDAFLKRPNRYTGNVRSVPNAVADTVFGLKVNDVDRRLSEKINKSKLKNLEREIDTEIFKVRKAKGLSKKEREKEIKIWKERKLRLKEQSKRR